MSFSDRPDANSRAGLHSGLTEMLSGAQAAPPSDAHCYGSLTAVTERELTRHLTAARAEPEKSAQHLDSFHGAFWLWFELTLNTAQQEQRDEDGHRFLDMVIEFPEAGSAPEPAPEPAPVGESWRAWEDTGDTLPQESEENDHSRLY